MQLYQVFPLKYWKQLFFPKGQKYIESRIPVFTNHLDFFFFKTNLFQRLYIPNVSTRSM